MLEEYSMQTRSQSQRYLVLKARPFLAYYCLLLPFVRLDLAVAFTLLECEDGLQHLA